MSLKTNLKGRVRNTNLPKANVLFPLFEAVVNAIHSIDERILKDNSYSIMDSKIVVKINRSSQTSLAKGKSKIIGFDITDNGIGFNDDNFNSFQTLDTEYKIEKGSKGIGRLLWLKAFKHISISSCYKNENKKQYRKFEFNISENIHKERIKICNSTDNIETTISLKRLDEKYEKHLPQNLNSISTAILEHCIWYFIREGGVPNIIVIDDVKQELSQLFEAYMINSSDTDRFILKKEEFEITHVKLKSTSHNKHTIIYSAADRVVKEEGLTNMIPGLFGVLNDGKDDFVYMCFVTSKYLTQMVNQERLGFNISESEDGMFEDENISFKEIRSNVVSKIDKYLNEFLIANKAAGLKKVKDFVAEKAPRYRPILKRISDDDKIVDPNTSDKELELKLHKHLTTIEADLLREGHDLMQPKNIEDEDDYKKRISDYLSKASDLKMSDLVNYVSHRKVIIDLLKNAINIGDDGKYSKEEVIHKLIMPTQTESDELFFDDSNLWLIDERLAFHNFLASDKTLKSMPITGAKETKEPDLISLNIYDNPLLVNNGQSLPLASITVVEIKRPMRNDAKQGEEKDPVEQALGYLKRVRDGKVKTVNGRLIPNSDSIPGFCYIISDITPSIQLRCDMLDLIVTPDKLGYFGYHKKFNTYIEVISYDRLVNISTERNKAFFDKLGLPSN